MPVIFLSAWQLIYLFCSNYRDNIFVNFVGHGSSGIIAFTDDYLYADELNSALQYMFDKRKFNKVIIF